LLLRRQLILAELSGGGELIGDVVKPDWPAAAAELPAASADTTWN